MRMKPRREEIWQHIKTGILVTILHGDAKLEWNEEPCVVYLHPGSDTKDGKNAIWVRTMTEFMERFKKP